MAGKGRPTRYTKALGDRICSQLAEGKSLRTVCRDPKMPAKTTVFRWLRMPSMKDFRDQYARAKEEAADAMAEDILDIADDGTNDYMEKLNKDGEPTGLYMFNKEAALRSRIRIDARKWLMAKSKPKKYGDKLDLTSGDEPIVPLTVFNMRPADVKKSSKTKGK